jgi:arsenate reductase
MAQALLRYRFGDQYEPYSAGTEPTEVNPLSIAVLEEKGIDTSSLWSKSVQEFVDMEFDEVVTVCDHAKEACPFFPGAKKYTHQGFVDPPDLIDHFGIEPMKAFRSVRDEIDQWITDHFSV